MAENANKTTEELKDMCKQAYNLYPKSCSHAVWHVIKQYKPDQHFMQANQLLNHISLSPEWQKVQLSDLSRLASNGILVVGGLQEIEKGHHGHVIVVYPGSEKNRGGYYYKTRAGKHELMPEKGIYARSMSTSIGSFSGAKSNGDKTVWDPWGSDVKFQKVKFWKYVGSKNIATPAESAVK